MQMSVSRKNVLTMAVLLGALTTFLVYLFLTRQGGPKPFAANDVAVASATTYVVVPREPIRPMTLLRADMFRLKKMSRREAPRDAVTVPADLADKVAVSALPADVPVERQMVAARSPELGLPYAVRPPRRAVTIAVDPVSGVAGFAKPGNRVDVLATFETDRGVGMVTRTVLQDVEILAFGPDTQPSNKESVNGKEGKPEVQTTATLAVLPTEAERLILAETRGKLRLALRPIEDDTYRTRTGTTEVQVTGVLPAGPAKTTAPPPPAPAAPRMASSIPPPAPAPATPPTVVMAPHMSAPGLATKPNPQREIEVVRGTQKEIVTVKDGRR
jgi:pilus assembly protein CpaB